MLKNMKIGKKLILTFLFISIFSSISGVLSVVVMKNINDEYTNALEYYGFAQGDIGNAMLALTKCQMAVCNIVSFTNQEDIDAQKVELYENWTNYQEIYRPAVEKSLTTDEGNEAFERIKEKGAIWIKSKDYVLSIGDTADPVQTRMAQDVVTDFLVPSFEDLYREYESLMNLKVDLGNSLSEELTNDTIKSIIVSVIVIILSLVFASFFAVTIANGISKPMKECVDRLNKLAMGDLDSPIPMIDTENEMGMLSNSTGSIVTTIVNVIKDISYELKEIENGNFEVESKASNIYVGGFKSLYNSMNEITVSLSDTLLQINQSSDQVSVGSEQVSSSAQALSQGATEQASAIQELSVTLDDMSNKINKNAINAVNAKKEVDRASSKIEGSNGQMKDMILAMNDISTKSNQISKIIKTIDDIAFQTNILALNAAVEAARAGEAGKGFAVVAAEVRNLSGKSAEAAKNTSSLIEETVKAVGIGVTIANNTAKAMITVVEGNKSVERLVDEIAEASTEQANAINQIAIAIEQISGVVQNNSATAEESAAASEELSAQAQILKIAVSKFKLRDSVENNLCVEDDLYIEDSLNQEIELDVEFSGKY